LPKQKTTLYVRYLLNTLNNVAKLTLVESANIVDLLKSQWDNLKNLGKELTENQFNIYTECPGWTIKDLYSHIIGTEKMLLGEKSPPKLEEPWPAHVKNPIGELNERWILFYKNYQPKELLTVFQEVTENRLSQLKEMKPQDFEKIGPTPIGLAPYKEFMSLRLWDCFVHEQDIRVASNKIVNNFDKEILNEVIKRLTKGISYVLAKKALIPEELRIVFLISDQHPLILQFQKINDKVINIIEQVNFKESVTIELPFINLVRISCGRLDPKDVLNTPNDYLQIIEGHQWAKVILENLNFVF